MDAFWDKARRHFSDSQVQSVDIVVVTGETLIHQKQKDICTPEDIPFYDDSDNDDDDNTHPSESDPTTTQEQMIAINGEGDEDDTNKQCKCSNSKDPHTIIETMQRHIEKKVEDDLKQSRNRMQLDSEFAGKYSPIKISLSVIDSTVDFHSLCQKWSRESLCAAIESRYGQTFPTIRFELPETTGFDSCDVSFATYYKNMPFRPDSAKARQLCADLVLLSKTNLQVVQLVPFPSIDASLIYGVTIGLRVVQQQDDEESDRENISLIQSLFHQLSKRDCALLLRSTQDPSNDESNCGERITRDDDGLFHSAEETQYFLFMPEFVVSKDGPAAPKTGVLRRIANVNHILEETQASDILNRASSLNLGKKKNSFSEYLEETLDSLKCSSVNPYHLSGI